MRHIVVVGGGFGGLSVVRSLAKEPVYVTLIDRNNHHTFQPLLYQVAMAGLSAAEIAVPTRSVVRSQKNARVLMGEVTNIHLDERYVELADGQTIAYDQLVVAAGAVTNYRGNDTFRRHALGLKDLDDAIEIRQRILLAFEAAEREGNEAVRQRLLTFVVVGGGPTGVELAGALAELSRFVLAKDFRHIQPGATRIILLEGGPRVLPSFSAAASNEAQRQLTDLGVDVRTNVRIRDIDERGVRYDAAFLPAATVIWAAGVAASPLARMLRSAMDRTGRVIVGRDCSLPCNRDVFVIGDMACAVDSKGVALPGVAPVAVQQGRLVAENIGRDLRGEPRKPFEYKNRGSMATIGRSRAVAERGGIRLSGLLAWLAWLAVHVLFLVGFRNRLVVLFDWFWSYVTYGRGSRLITGRKLRGRARHLANVLASADLEGEAPTTRHAARLPADVTRVITQLHAAPPVVTALHPASRRAS